MAAVTLAVATERDLARGYRKFDEGGKVEGLDAQDWLDQYAYSVNTRVTVRIDLPYGWLECHMKPRTLPRGWELASVLHHSSREPADDVTTVVHEGDATWRFADDKAEVELGPNT